MINSPVLPWEIITRIISFTDPSKCPILYCLYPELFPSEARNKIKDDDLRRLLFWATKEGMKKLCQKIINLGGANETYIYHNMMEIAALNGHRHICELVKEKWEMTAFHDMIYGAAKGGHKELCELAREWGANSLVDLNWMLYGAAEGEQEDLCYLAKKWGACDFYGMIHCVRAYKSSPNRKLLDLAIKWKDEWEDSVRPFLWKTIYERTRGKWGMIKKEYIND